MSRRDYVSLPISSSILGDPFDYDNQKIKRKSLWRWWKQKSRFQRSLLGLLCALVIILFIYLLPTSRTLQLLTSSTDSPSNKVLPRDNEDQVKDPIQENAVPEPVQIQNNQIPDTNENQHQLIEPERNIVKETEEVKKIINFVGPTNDRQKAVVAAFQHAWNAYKNYAWGHDNLKPISKSFSDWFGLGLTIVDGIDTVIIMGLKDEYQEAKKFISDVLNFDKNKDVNLFEVTIRVLGGLLAAYHVTSDWMFVNKAIDLGDRLLPCFDSPSGIPYSDVNLRSHRSHPPRWGPDSSVSEVSTIQMEFRDLSRITGDPKYEAAAARVTQQLHDQPKQDGLVPMFINAETGKFRSFTTITLGARGDSYYEYLLKQWIQTGKTQDFILKDYNESVSGMMSKLLRYSEPNKLAFLGELTNGKHFKPKMDHLVCFLPSVLILGYHNGLPESHLKLAKELIYTCYQMYAQMPTFLSPEIVHFNINPTSDADIYVKIADKHNLLRPETVESLWYMYHFTKNETYREWGWRIFQAFEKYTKIADAGYTSIDDVKNTHDPSPKDMMESFFLAETLKYFYLLFNDDQTTLSLDKWIFNTEGHPLPILTT